MPKSAAISALVSGESQSPDRSNRPAREPTAVRLTRRTLWFALVRLCHLPRGGGGVPDGVDDRDQSDLSTRGFVIVMLGTPRTTCCVRRTAAGSRGRPGWRGPRWTLPRRGSASPTRASSVPWRHRPCVRRSPRSAIRGGRPVRCSYPSNGRTATGRCAAHNCRDVRYATGCPVGGVSRPVEWLPGARRCTWFGQRTTRPDARPAAPGNPRGMRPGPPSLHHLHGPGPAPHPHRPEAPRTSSRVAPPAPGMPHTPDQRRHHHDCSDP